MSSVADVPGFARRSIYTLLVILLSACADSETPAGDRGEVRPGDSLVFQGETPDTADAPAQAAPGVDAPSVAAAPPAEDQSGATAGETSGGPPLGRYVCRQYMTTMGYLTLAPGGVYEVSGVQGRYRFDPGSGDLIWEGGSYDEWDWDGTYEHVVRAEDDGRPDEHVIRIVSEADGLRINCYKMAED